MKVLKRKLLLLKSLQITTSINQNAKTFKIIIFMRSQELVNTCANSHWTLVWRFMCANLYHQVSKFKHFFRSRLSKNISSLCYTSLSRSGKNITLHNAYHKCIWLRNLLLNLAIVVALALFRYSRDICHFRIRFNILVLLSWQPPNVKILIFLSSSIKEGISDATKVMQKDKMHKRFEEENILKKETRCWITFL